MSWHEDMSEMALDLLTEYGADAVIQRKTAAPESTTTTTTGPLTLDASTVTVTETPAPWVVPAQTTLEYPCKAVVSNYHESVLDGTTIRQGDKKIIIAAQGLTIEPAVTDVIVCNSVAYNIVAVTVVSPAGTPIIYVVQARL